MKELLFLCVCEICNLKGGKGFFKLEIGRESKRKGLIVNLRVKGFFGRFTENMGKQEFMLN